MNRNKFKKIITICWCSTKGGFLPRGYLGMPGYMFGCYSRRRGWYRHLVHSGQVGLELSIMPMTVFLLLSQKCQ